VKGVKGDNENVKLARRLRQETTISLKWIAERLEMGRWADVFNLLGAERLKTNERV